MHFGNHLKRAATLFLTASALNIAISGWLALDSKAGAQAEAQSQTQTQSQGQARAYQTVSPRGPEPMPSLTMAKELYRVHRYAEAANLFQQAVQKGGAGAGAYLWMAHCQYAMGHLQQAIPDYVHVRDAYRGTPESKVAAQFLSRLDPTGKIQAAGGGAVHGSGAVVSLAGAAGAQSGSLLEGMEIVRPVAGHPEVATSTVDLVKENIKQLPQVVQRMLLSQGIKFCITTTLVDKFPAMGYQEGRGYDGHTYKSCPGMFSNGTVIICERLVDEASNEVQAPIPAGPMTETFYHEIGHALDSCLGSYSTTDDYRHAYYLDIAHIPPDAANRLAYYMQKSVAGQQESCGEITAVCLGSGEHNAQDIKTYFPLTMAFIKKKLNVDEMQTDSPGQIAGRADGHHI